MRKLILYFVLVSVLFLSGCGTIIYPERRGNTAQVDVAVVLLDAVGLLFFIIPGVIAYAVDLSTGCIYLSGKGKHSSLAEVVPLDTSKDIEPQVNQILHDRYGAMANNALEVKGIVGVNNWYQLQAMGVTSGS